MSCDHKVDETKTRSLSKTAVSKGIEIAIDTVVITTFSSIGVPPLMIALTIEGICFANHFIIERLFNRVQWGRKITNIT